MPTTFAMHPEVKTVVRLAGHLDTLGDATDAYEAGHLLVADKANFGLTPTTWQLVRSADCPVPPAGLYFKKGGTADFLAPLGPAGHPLHVLFPRHPEAAAAMQGVIRTVNGRVRAAVARLFPGYRVVDEHITWRLTDTGREPVHFDSYLGHDQEAHAVRLFFNLDDRPRVWGVGQPVWDTLRAHPEVAAEMAKDDIHPNVFNNRLGTLPAVLDGPRHTVAFAPGAAWLVNTQMIAHEIVSGRRLLAATFFVDPDTARDPSRVFPALVRRVVKELA